MSKAGFFTPTELAFGLTIGKNEAVQPFDFTVSVVIFNIPGVAGAVLKIPLPLIH